MIKIERTISESNDFIFLSKKLDQELKLIYGTTQDEFDRFNIIENIETVIIAYINNTAAGCGCFKTFDDKTIELKRMFVDEPFRNKGIGAAILIELENWAKELGFSSIVLETGTVQIGAVTLYKKYGYSVIPNFGPYLGNELSICFNKSL